METLHPEPGAAAGQRYERMTAVAAFRLAAAHTWPAAFCPAVFGIFWCLQRGIPLSPVQCVLLTAACILAQSSVNTLNDYVDYVGGTDSEDDNVEVNDAVLVYSHIDPKHALRLGIGYLLTAGICGVAAALHSGPVPYLIGLAGGATVLAYSVSPIPVSALPLGEVISGFVMGVLIPLGIAAVGDGKFHPEMIPECLPLFLGIALIMLSNNGSDIEKDIPQDPADCPRTEGIPGPLPVHAGTVDRAFAHPAACLSARVHRLSCRDRELCAHSGPGTEALRLPDPGKASAPQQDPPDEERDGSQPDRQRSSGSCLRGGLAARRHVSAQ